MSDQWNKEGGEALLGKAGRSADRNGDRAPTVDITVLQQYRDLQEEGDPDIVTELIDTFFGDVPSRLSGIREAVNSGNPTQLEREAHTLKGSSANLGAKALSAISYELEKMGRESELEGAEAIVERLEAEFTRVHERLEQERKAT